MPLADKLRPEKISEIFGQEHLLGDNGIIKKMVDNDRIKSMILHGKAGIGKTTIAKCLANEISGEFVSINATSAKVDDIRKIVTSAIKKRNQGVYTILLVDEIHRFAKNQQEVLLPSVENGDIILIGLTVEKPEYSITSPLLSRVLVFELFPLNSKDLLQILKKVLQYYIKLGKNIAIDKLTIKLLLNRSNGDARRLITSLETIIEILLGDDNTITEQHVDVAIPTKFMHFDKSGNEHFDYAAAWQNSVQKSDVDQAIYFLAKWLLSGESELYIARRILVSASEDACLNPYAAIVANNAFVAAKEVGMPEFSIVAAHATIEIAKSTRDKVACNAINEAINDIKNNIDTISQGEMKAGNHEGYVKVINKKYVKYKN